MGREPRLRWGLRPRITLAAAAAVGVAMAAGAAVLAGAARGRIEAALVDAATARAEAVAAAAEAGALGPTLPGRDPRSVAQVVSRSGVVVSADAAVAGLRPLGVADLPPGEVTVEREASLFEEGEAAGGPEDRGPYVVVRRGLDDAGVVVVAASLEGSDEAVAAVAPLLSVGGAVLLGLVAAVTWVATGAGLRPVEAMRGEAARISTAGLERRLPVPAADDELRRLAVTLNEMLDRLEASAVRRRRFVADASHELRSPLAALRTIVEVGVAPAADAALTADLLGEIGRLQRLVDDLLFLAAADERVPIRRARVELDRLVEEQAGVLVARRQAVLDTSLLRPVAVAGDPDLIARLVRNLTENAARHAASSVWVETTEEDGWAVLRVDDDGAGIPPEDRERVFERFVRLDEGRSRDEGGTGLGLAIARAAARRHGGDVRVVEPRHGGAGLEARLPLGVGD